jgi:hypothetical protein
LRKTAQSFNRPLVTSAASGLERAPHARYAIGEPRVQEFDKLGSMKLRCFGDKAQANVLHDGRIADTLLFEKSEEKPAVLRARILEAHLGIEFVDGYHLASAAPCSAQG